MANKKVKESSNEEFKLPRYLRLNKGAMWFDTEGENCSGVTLFSIDKYMVGRDPKNEEDTEPVKDEFENKNIVEFGYKKKELPWYIDTSVIPAQKLSRIILAFKHKILVEADPNNPPKVEKEKDTREFSVKENGDRIFVGKNKAMFRLLMNKQPTEIKKFIMEAPLTPAGRENLMDLLEYEQRGHNPVSRPRLEVLDWIRQQLQKYGPGLSAIRINEDN